MEFLAWESVCLLKHLGFSNRTLLQIIREEVLGGLKCVCSVQVIGAPAFHKPGPAIFSGVRELELCNILSRNLAT